MSKKIRLDEDILIELFINQNKTVNEIAKELDVSYSTVARALRDYDIKKSEDARRANISKTKQSKTEEEKQIYRQHLSEARKGKGLGQIPWNKGTKGVCVAWNKGIPCSDETKQRLRDNYQNLSDEEKERRRTIASKIHKDQIPWNKGLRSTPNIEVVKKTKVKKIKEKKVKVEKVKERPIVLDENNIIISDLEKSIVSEVLSSEFPYPVYKDEVLNKSYTNLQKSDGGKGNTALDIVRHFHHSIWSCNVNGHESPLEAWSDPDLVLKVVRNRLHYRKNKDLTLTDILGGFSITKIAPKVSIFRPALAKYLIKKYLNEYSTIFDPCAGFSGRMLGTCSLGKHYIGQDCNYTTINEACQLKDNFNLSAELYHKNSIYTTGECECLFTCPPYMTKKGDMLEIWNEEIEPLSEDEWIDVCLKNYKCKKYLFVVGNTEKYKDNIVEVLTNKSHFSNKKEYVILINNEKSSN